MLNHETPEDYLFGIMLCVLIVTLLLGSMMGAMAICAPILIPVVAAVGLTPSTLAVIFQTVAETGLIWGPFGAPTLIVMELAAISYADYMIWAAIPFGIVWCVMLYFVAKRVNKKTEGIEHFDIESMGASGEESTLAEKRTTVAFLISFVCLVAYAMIKTQGIAYVVFVL